MRLTSVPDSLDVYLPLTFGKATLHRYSHSAPVVRGDLHGTGHYFKCVETGTLRLYGFE